jgi:aspartyl-tRNA(Asn)/glutamyl-tRNA(Gln) amidotransferase subunit C
MSLDRAEVEHIGILARIGLTKEEVEVFREQLSDILEQFEILGELDTTGVSPAGHWTQGEAAMRDDSTASSLDPEEALSNAPRREGDFFRVKAVLEE